MRSLPAATAMPVLIMLLSAGGCSGDVVTTTCHATHALLFCDLDAARCGYRM